jgi:serine/threonine protein kinase
MSNQETLLKNRYRLIAQHGSGGMAVIYKAYDQELGRMVAVKILRPSLIADPSFLERFRNEARSVARLSHPNIVTVHDVGQDGSTHFIVMEFIDGVDLKKLVRAEAPFTIQRALDLAIKVSAGVGYAHRSGLVHADVKPQNVLIAEGDVLKVTDFGIAQALSDAATNERQRVVWGSPHYFSPEQARGERPTPASDVYSIGVVLFEMLTGRLPFIGADQQELAMAHIKDAPPHPMEFNPAVPPELDHIIHKVMSKEPSSRYRTADQLGRILISYLRQGQRSTSDQVRPVNVPPPAANGQPVANPQPAVSRFPSDHSGLTRVGQPQVQQLQTPLPVQGRQQFPAPQVPRPASFQGQISRPMSISAPEPEEPANNLVTFVLAFLALTAFLGLIPLGLAVLSAYQ